MCRSMCSLQRRFQLLVSIRTFSSRGLQGQKINFVPKHASVSQNDVEKLSKFVSTARNLLVITGAGISTESGIPDYR